jgi:hypothetical protein
MAKSVYVYFAWQDRPKQLQVQDNELFRDALRILLPASMKFEEFQSAIDETGVNVIDQLGKHLKENVKITISRNKVYEGGWTRATQHSGSP